MDHALQAIQQSQRDHANDLLTDDIPTFDGTPSCTSTGF